MQPVNHTDYDGDDDDGHGDDEAVCDSHFQR